jgi:hypothetical protein
MLAVPSGRTLFRKNRWIRLLHLIFLESLRYPLRHLQIFVHTVGGACSLKITIGIQLLHPVVIIY